MRSWAAWVVLVVVGASAGCLLPSEFYENPVPPSDYVDEWVLDERFAGAGVTYHRRDLVPVYDGILVRGLLQVEVAAQRKASELVIAQLYVEADENGSSYPLETQAILTNDLTPELAAHLDGESPVGPVPLPLKSLNGGDPENRSFEREIFALPGQSYRLVLAVAHVASTEEFAPRVRLELTLDSPRLARQSEVTTDPAGAGILSLREGRGMAGSEATVDTGVAGVSHAASARGGFRLRNDTLFVGVVFVLNATFEDPPLNEHYVRTGRADVHVSNGLKAWDFAVGVGAPSHVAAFGRHEGVTDPWAFEVAGTGAIEFLVWYADLPSFF